MNDDNVVDMNESEMLLSVFSGALKEMTEVDRELLTVVSLMITDKLASFPTIPTLTDKV